MSLGKLFKVGQSRVSFNELLNFWRMYIMYPLHAMDLSPYVGPTSVYNPHVVKALNVYREYKISFTEFL